MLRIYLIDPKTMDDYEPLVAVHNQSWPDDLRAATEWHHFDLNRATNFLFQRFVAELDGELIAECVVMEPSWMYVPGKYVYFYSLIPDHEMLEIEGESIHARLCAFVVDYLASREPLAIIAYAREDRLTQIRWLTDNGFRQQMRYPESLLDVRKFDPAPFDRLRERLAADGIEFMTLPALQAVDPDWQRRVYELCSELELDIPSPDPPTPEPFDEFVKMFSNPNFVAEGWLIAVDNGRSGGHGDGKTTGPYVGITMLAARQATPERMSTWLTGVTRPYRRRGIALALKVASIEFARRRGVAFISTDNEENNPMFQINLKLGFEPTPAWMDFERTLA